MHSWLQIVYCFGLSILVLFLLGVAGRIVSFNQSSGTSKTIFSFTNLVKGLLFCTSLYAILKTGGRTVLLPVPLLIVLHGFIDKGNKQIQHPETKHLFLRLLLPCLAVHFLYYLQAYISWDPAYYTYPDGDHLFYSRVVQYLNIQAIENARIEYLYPERFAAEPYHWGDMWFGALLHGLTKADHHYLVLLTASPVLSAIFSMGVYSYVNLLLPQVSKKSYIIWLCVFAPLLSGLPFTYPSFLYEPFIFIKSAGYYPKLLWVACILIWLLIEIRAKAWSRTLVVCAVGALSFLNILPAIVSSVGLLVLYLLFKKKTTIKALLPGLIACVFAAGYFYFFYQSQKPVAVTGNENVEGFAIPSMPVILKLMAASVLKGLLQLARLLPYILLLMVAWWGAGKIKLMERLKKVPLELGFFVLLMAMGLVSWGLLSFITRDAMQSFQNVYMPALCVLIVVLIAYLTTTARFLRYAGILAGGVILVNLLFHYKFDYQVGTVSKEEYAKAQGFFKNPNVIMVNHKAAKYLKTKYAANTVLSQPMGYLDYQRNLYVNASLDIPYAQFTDVEPHQEKDIEHVVQWAPYSYFLSKQRAPKKEESALTFIRQIKATGICVSTDTLLPTAIKSIVADSITVKSGWRIYKLKNP